MKKILLYGALSAAILMLSACSDESSSKASKSVKASEDILSKTNTEQREAVSEAEEETVSYTEKHLINENELSIYLKVPDPFEVKDMSFDEAKVKKSAELKYREYSFSDSRHLIVYFDGEITYNPDNSQGNIEFKMALCDEEGKSIKKDSIAVWDVKEGDRFTTQAEFTVPSSGNYTIEFIDED